MGHGPRDIGPSQVRILIKVKCLAQSPWKPLGACPPHCGAGPLDGHCCSGKLREKTMTGTNPAKPDAASSRRGWGSEEPAGPAARVDFQPQPGLWEAGVVITQEYKTTWQPRLPFVANVLAMGGPGPGAQALWEGPPSPVKHVRFLLLERG